MNHHKILLTFEWDAKNELLEIHGNKAGLENLRKLLRDLSKRKGDDHQHLMTPLWGGNELSDPVCSSENVQIHHVKIYKWEDK